ncbi:MAG: hypothetical protein IPI30_23670 [Saprospiraceae bacterium]|nr:hypothetical protein [Candidatus Vicinibacter affinis]
MQLPLSTSPKKGKVFDSPCRFIGNIESKVNATQPRINALQALEKLIFHYDVKNAVMPVEKRRSNDKDRYFEKTNFTHSDIPARLMYFQTKDGKLRLTWDVSTDFVDRRRLLEHQGRCHNRRNPGQT